MKNLNIILKCDLSQINNRFFHDITAKLSEDKTTIEVRTKSSVGCPDFN